MIKSIGPHKVSCSSIDEPIIDQMLRGGPKVSIFYSDPPWSDGNIKFFATMYKNMNGTEITPITFETLIGRVFELIDNYVEGHIFIEMGNKLAPQVIARLDKKYFNVKKFDAFYKGGSKLYPNTIIYAATHPHFDIPASTSVKHIQGGQAILDTFFAAAKVPPGSLVLDPCCGFGMTGRAAVKAGLAFRGNELNPGRLQRGINWLENAVKKS